MGINLMIYIKRHNECTVIYDNTSKAGVCYAPALCHQLLSQSETCDKASVSLDVSLSQILEKASSLSYHLEKTSS